MTNMGTPPGWFPDPGHEHELRWWDGGKWTAYTDAATTQGFNIPSPATISVAPTEYQESGSNIPGESAKHRGPSDPDAAGGRRIPIRTSFRYVHEPLVAEDGPIPLLGHQDIIEQLRNQLRHSDGGTLLVSGFRGAGKTTVVQRALTEMTKLTDGRVVTVALNIARPMSTSELLFAVIRRLFEVLAEDNLFDILPDDVQRALLLAFLRTSLQLAQSRTNSSERSTGLSIGGASPRAGLIGSVLGSLLPKLDLGRTNTSSLAVEASFLTYSDTDVEHDFMAIVEMLGRPHKTPSKRRRWRRGVRNREQPAKIRLVVVLDELDKLTATESGLAALETLLSGLKNVLTSAGSHFVFVAGPDIFDVAASDSARGTGIYDSVFAWQVYVPCLWRAPELLLSTLLPTSSSDMASVCHFLEFKSRGIPRRLLQEFNALVRWFDDVPHLELSEAALRRAYFFARLQTVVSAHLGASPILGTEPNLREDRRRLGAYYATEWVLRSGGRVFGVPDIMEDTGGPETIDPSVVIDARQLGRLLESLAAEGILTEVLRASPDSTYIGSALSSEITAYYLVDDVRLEYESLEQTAARDHLPFRTARDVPDPQSAQPLKVWSDAITGTPADTLNPANYRVAPTYVPSVSNTDSIGAPASSALLAPSTMRMTMAEGRYRITGRIGVGATGTVYSAEDQVDGREVAIKLLELRAARMDPDVRARFQREVGIALSLRHPSFVRTLDSFEDAEGRLGLVMDRLYGPTLAEVKIPSPIYTVVGWGVHLCDALQYLYERGIARIDLKPSNIIVVPSGRPVIVDLGLAKRADAEAAYNTSPTELVGTPLYMAPEQIEGETADIRSDIFSLGTILFELLGGNAFRPFLDSVLAVLYRTIHEDVPVEKLGVSTELRDVIRRATARIPSERFLTPEMMSSALRRVPDLETIN